MSLIRMMIREASKDYKFNFQRLQIRLFCFPYTKQNIFPSSFIKLKHLQTGLKDCSLDKLRGNQAEKLKSSRFQPATARLETAEIVTVGPARPAIAKETIADSLVTGDRRQRGRDGEINPQNREGDHNSSHL